MHIFKLDNCKNYQDAGERVIEYSQINIQKKSFEEFLNTSVPDLLRIPIISYNGDDKWVKLTFKDSYIDYSSMKTVMYCKKFNETRYVLLKAIGVLEFSTGQIVEFPITLTKIPYIEESAIINGSDKILVSHLEPNNTLHFNTYKEDNTLEMKMQSMYSQKPLLIMTINLKSVNDLFRFNLSGQAINENIGDFLINNLGYSLLEIPDITGSVLYSYINYTNKNTRINSDNISRLLQRAICSKYERSYINNTLSYKTRAVGKYLSNGTLITDEVAESLQKEFKIYVKDEPNENISGYYIYSNGFASLNFLLKDLGLDYQLEKDITVHIPTFNKLFDLHSDVERVVKENLNELIKLTLTKEDIVALVNIFGHFIQGKVSKEDAYSLNDKILVSVNDIYVSGMLKLRESLSKRLDSCRNYNLTQEYLTEEALTNILNVINPNSQENINNNLRVNYDTNNDLNQIIKAFNDYSQSDVYDNTSPFSEINHLRKLTLTYVEGRGGVKSTDANLTSRMVHPTFMGRIDLNETSEGANVGLIRYLTCVAYVNEERQILAPFFKVNNGIVDISTAYYMTCEEEYKYVVCLDSEVALEDKTIFKLFDKNRNLIKEITYNNVIDEGLINYTGNNLCIEYDAYDFECKTFVKNKILKDIVNVNTKDGQDFRPVDEVDYIITTPEHLMSVVSAANVFTNYNDNARILYLSNQTKQGICINKPDVPYVISKLTDKFTHLTGIEKSPIDGIVLSATNKKIVIKGIDKKEYVIDLIDDVSTKESTILYAYPNVNVGDFVSKGQIITNTNSSKEGQVTNGVNLRVGIMPFYGFNFEDGIVISDRLVREGILTSHHASTIEINDISLSTVSINKMLSVPLCVEINYSKYPKTSPPDKLFDIPVIVEADRYRKLADILNIDGTPKKRSVIQGDTLIAYFKLEKDKEDNYVYKLREKLYEEYSKAYISSVVRFQNRKENCVYIKLQLQHEEVIEVGDKLSGRHGNKGVTSKIFREMDMPYLEDGTRLDILLNPLGIPSRMNIGQVLELHFGELLQYTDLQIVLENGITYNKAELIDLFSIYDGKIKQTVYDGITGLPYENKIAVGCSTIVKSKHQVSHKIHSRSIGGYTAYRSPTQGRANGGGQSLGYMELHALAESGCSNVLSELINLKSDKVEGRNAFQAYLSNMSGDINPEKFNTSEGEMAWKTALKDFDVDRGLSFASKTLLARSIALLSYPMAYDGEDEINLFTNSIDNDDSEKEINK